ncbi:MAG: hypothetical protein ND895_00775 [Pyrinomonadaceae bacterium]|nr:hypothetical protein [Pyrinomonadaceae bacterium]
MFTRQRSILAIVGISIAIAVLAAASPARSQVAPPTVSLPRFGMVGIARGQVARLNAVMTEPPDPSTDPPDPSAPNGIAPLGVQPTPFRVRLGFVGANGLPLRDRAGNVISMEVLLLPGQGVWLDLDAGDVLGLFESRKQIRPVVSHIRGATEPPDPAIPVVVTLEIFNRLTGRTESLYAPAGVEPPDPSAPR